MANLSSSSSSPPPSGSSSNRRLSELLEEQQEPFSLDLYLLDRGCSTALLDASGASSSACWPRSRRAARTPRRPAPASRKTRGLLRLVLSKILRGTAAAPKKMKKQQQPVAIGWGGAVDGEKLRNNRKNAAPSSPSPRRLHDAVKIDMEEEEEDDDDDDEDDPRQLSPVSVLKQRAFQAASPAHTQKAMAIFKELLAAAYTPALPDHLARDSSNENTPTTASTPAPAPAVKATGRAKNSAAAARWQERLEEEVAKVHDLAAETAGGGRMCTGDVGTDVADAVLDELVVELAVELIGNIGHDDHDAIDVARCGWCS